MSPSKIPSVIDNIGSSVATEITNDQISKGLKNWMRIRRNETKFFSPFSTLIQLNYC